jgi:hypothetical protein
MLAALVQACRKPQDLIRRPIVQRDDLPETPDDPCVSVPVLSTIKVSIVRRRSMASASRNNTPTCAARPVATMIDIGVAKPSAHGQAMISTATALTTAYVHEGSGPKKPSQERRQRHRQNREDEPEAGLVRHALHRRPRALRLRYELPIWDSTCRSPLSRHALPSVPLPFNVRR